MNFKLRQILEHYLFLLDEKERYRSIDEYIDILLLKKQELIKKLHELELEIEKEYKDVLSIKKKRKNGRLVQFFFYRDKNYLEQEFTKEKQEYFEIQVQYNEVAKTLISCEYQLEVLQRQQFNSKDLPTLIDEAANSLFHALGEKNQIAKNAYTMYAHRMSDITEALNQLRNVYNQTLHYQASIYEIINHISKIKNWKNLGYRTELPYTFYRKKWNMELLDKSEHIIEHYYLLKICTQGCKISTPRFHSVSTKKVKNLAYSYEAFNQFLNRCEIQLSRLQITHKKNNLLMMEIQQKISQYELKEKEQKERRKHFIEQIVNKDNETFTG